MTYNTILQFLINLLKKERPVKKNVLVKTKLKTVRKGYFRSFISINNGAELRTKYVMIKQ